MIEENWEGFQSPKVESLFAFVSSYIMLGFVINLYDCDDVLT